MADYMQFTRAFIDSDRPVILAGDLNICHTEDDIWNPGGNRNTSGFLDNERAWFSRMLESGWHDLFREHRGPGKGPYSWWSNRGNARADDKGWRIDYFLGNRVASEMVERVEILRQGGIDISDHAPVILDLSR